jgi:hypothetical protein
MPNGHLVTPKVVGIILLANLGPEVGSFAFQLSQHMIAEIQTRGSNLALQYGLIAASAITNDGRADLTLPLTYFKETMKVMSEAVSPQEAATQGVIALGVLTLSGCSSGDNTASLAYGALVVALCQNVFFPGSQSILSIFSVKVYIVKKVLVWLVTEIRIEKRRRQLKLPYVNIFKDVNIFRAKKKKSEDFIFLAPRIKKRKIRIFSKNLVIPVLYQKKLRIK